MYSSQLANVHPSILAGKLLAQNDRTVLESGNRNHAPSNMILQKISSDSKNKFDLDSDFHMFLCKLRQKYLNDNQLQGTHVSGFIQGYSIYPAFSVTLFTEKQILEIIKLSKENFVMLHFVATGSIFSQPPDSDTRVFYYSLVLPADDWRPTVAALEFISCGHSVRAIHSCLDILVEALKKYSNKLPIVDVIETDFGKAVIQSACKAFNNIDLGIYMNLIFDEINHPEYDEKPLTIIHVCSSHLIKAAMKRIRQFTSNETLQELLRSAISLLVHASDLEHALELFGVFVKLFNCKYKAIEYDILLDKLTKIKPLDIEDISQLYKDSDDDDDFDKEVIDFEFCYSNSKREQLKFYRILFRKQEEIMNCRFTELKNDYYTPSFISYLLDELLPYYVLWSAIKLKTVGLRRNSNSCVESWNKIIKQFVFDGKMRQVIPRAIDTLQQNITNRLIQREYDCRISRQNENKMLKQREASVVLKDDNTETNGDKIEENEINIDDLTTMEEEMKVLGIYTLI